MLLTLVYLAAIAQKREGNLRLNGFANSLDKEHEFSGLLSLAVQN